MFPQMVMLQTMTNLNAWMMVQPVFTIKVLQVMQLAMAMLILILGLNMLGMKAIIWQMLI